MAAAVLWTAAPNFVRSSNDLESAGLFGATEESWKDVALTHPEARKWGFIASETPVYAGRAIAAVAADPDRQRWSGGVWNSGTFSEAYDFTDLDGSRPNLSRYLAKHHPDLMKPKPGVVAWKLG